MDDSPLRVLARRRDELEESGRKELEAEGFGLEGLAAQVFLDMRYAGQSYEIAIPAESLAPADFLPAFHAAHQTRFGHSDPTRTVEVINLRAKLLLPGIATRSGKEESGKLKAKRATASSQREVWFDGKPAVAAIYDRDDLCRRAGRVRWMKSAILSSQQSSAEIQGRRRRTGYRSRALLLDRRGDGGHTGPQRPLTEHQGEARLLMRRF